MRLSLVILALPVLLLGAFSPAALGQPFPVPAGPVSSDEKVRRAIDFLSVADPGVMRNRSITTLYDLGRDDRLTALYRAVWKNDRAAYPSLAWGTLERPDVRIAFGQFWAQYIRNTTGNAAEMADVRRYVVQYLNDPDMRVRADALGYLGPLGQPGDVPALLAACSQDALPVATSAAMALSILLDKRAIGPLQECRSRTGNPAVQGAVDSILARMPR